MVELKKLPKEAFVMSRSYRHIKDYEYEIEKLRKEGYTSREIGNKLGFSYKQMRNYFYRKNVTERKIQAGIALKRRGRPPKDCIVSETDKVSELKYILARKESKIKQIEMEKELMREFLSLTERK